MVWLLPSGPFLKIITVGQGGGRETTKEAPAILLVRDQGDLVQGGSTGDEQCGFRISLEDRDNKIC